MSTIASQRPARWAIWLLAARPATLPAAIAPVLVGTAVATRDADFRAGPFVAALCAAVLIQIGTNYANDLSDFSRGADGDDRLGPPRATSEGWTTPAQMRLALLLVFAAAAALGSYLTVAAGWPVLVVGVAALVASVTYTGGPWPYGYHGLGDVFVFVFFGGVAVMGSGYVQVERLTWDLLAASIPVACLVTAILVVNNLRDVDSDRRVAKRTLAVILGANFARREYAVLVLLPFALVPIFAAADLMPWWGLLTWAVLPIAVVLIRKFFALAAGRELNVLLKRSGQLHLLFGVLLAVGQLL